MLICKDCSREFETKIGRSLHWRQTHDPTYKKPDRSGANNPRYGCKGKNGYTNLDWSKVPWEKLGHQKRRERLLIEANHACTQCGFNKRRPDGACILEVDHIDGDHKNNERSNLRVLCLNCHGLTPNFRNWGNKKGSRRSTRTYRNKLGQVAQSLEERQAVNLDVVGSNPTLFAGE